MRNGQNVDFMDSSRRQFQDSGNYGSSSINQSSKRMGISPKGLGSGPMRGIHPHPFSHPFKSPSFAMHDELEQRNEELSKLVLPKIEKRKLSDLMTDDVKNPFTLEGTTERVLVKREK